jgi:outer membrane protein OmpA-like peptidoglycan-associated protein
MVPRGADTPDLDRDADGISDARDRCPTDPETYNGFNDEDGCPDKGKVIIEGSDILILDKIMFRNGTDAVAPESMPLVDAMAATMKHHPEFLKVEISGHTDSTGGPMRNQRLSERRARAVLELLVKKGIDPHRLVAVGYGGACPITKELSEADREKNRRVEFKVLETEDGLTGVWTCAQAKRRPGEPQRVPSTWMESRPLQVRHVADPSENSTPGLEGDALSIQKLLDDQHPKDALPLAIANRDAHPRDSLAWVELGNVFALGSEPGKAARAYGSLIDLGNDSAEMRRAAGGLLEFAASVGAKTDAGVAARALDLAVESYRAALERRPDHPSSYRLLAFALARQGKYDEAFRVLYDAYGVRFRPDLAPAKPILAGDLGVIGAALAAKDSASDDFVRRRLASLGVRWPTLPSLRFVLTWETDASDVNLYVKTNEAWRSTESSGSNLRDGYGPEQIVVDPSELPARIGVRLTRRGPQGHALGKVDVVYADAAGNLVFDARPFAVQREGGYVALGEFALGAK